jgi:hypothetical protein
MATPNQLYFSASIAIQAVDEWILPCLFEQGVLYSKQLIMHSYIKL